MSRESRVFRCFNVWGGGRGLGLGFGVVRVEGVSVLEPKVLM